MYDIYIYIYIYIYVCMVRTSSPVRWFPDDVYATRVIMVAMEANMAGDMTARLSDILTRSRSRRSEARIASFTYHEYRLVKAA